MSSVPTNPPCLAFTTRFVGKVNVLITDLDVFVPDGFPNAGKSVKIKAIWDTGATASVITQKVVAELGMIPIGRSVVHRAGGRDTVNAYIADFGLPNRLRVNHLQVTSMELTGADALVGMDVIGSGDFAVTEQNGKTVLSYRFPHQNLPIDFIPGAQKANKKRQSAANPSARSLRKKARKSH